MIQHFNNLTAEETRALVDAIPLITILIAGADGNIDRREKTWALKLSRIRTYTNPEDLHEYYHYVGASYGDMLNTYIDKLPKKVQKRNQIIAYQLSLLNEIFPKLDPKYASALYRSFVSFAQHVARASGGFLGFGSESLMEKKLMYLPMLEPVLVPD